jgi:membrane fusion protein, multidrug efflux system
MNSAGVAPWASSNHKSSDPLPVPTLLAAAWQRIFVLVSVGLLSLCLGGCGKPQIQTVAPAEVEVAAVGRRDVPVTQEWVASLYGFVDTQVRAQVSGLLLHQNYRDGAGVKKGDLLFEIDPRPFRAALDQAEGQLAQADAQFGKTQQDVKRYGPLAREQAISQQQYDDAIQANVAAGAQVASARATVERAQLDLDFARITSPVDGIASIVQVQIGDLVGPGSGILATVSTEDPIKVYFPISEQAYLDFIGEDAGGKARSFPADAKLNLILSNGSIYPYPGKFYAADNQIDSSTGTLRIEVLFPNPQNALRPGQYARVRAVVRTLKDALIVPERALAELQGGYQVVTVDGFNKAHLQAVKVGARVDGMAVIEEGLKPGDRVIVDGLTKVREGTSVHPQASQPAS